MSMGNKKKDEFSDLKREDLIRIILKTRAENEALRKRVEERKILLDDAGDIATAALVMNNVFVDAQKAADEYLKNIKDLSERQAEVLARKEREANTKISCMLKETDEECKRREKLADERVKAKYEELQDKIDAFLESRNGLRELFDEVNPKDGGCVVYIPKSE